MSNLLIKTDISKPANQNPRPSWKASTEEEKELYKKSLDEKQYDIFVPIPLVTCNDVKCCETEQCDMLDKLAIDVIETIQSSAED